MSVEAIEATGSGVTEPIAYRPDYQPIPSAGEVSRPHEDVNAPLRAELLDKMGTEFNYFTEIRTEPSPMGHLIYFLVREYDTQLKAGDYVVGGISTTMGVFVCFLPAPIIHAAKKHNIAAEILYQIGGCGSTFLMSADATSRMLNSFREELDDIVKVKIGDKTSLGRKIARISLIGPFSALASLPLAMAVKGGLTNQILVEIGQTTSFFNPVGNIMLGHGGKLWDAMTCDQQHRDYLLIRASVNYAVQRYSYHRMCSTEEIPLELTRDTQLSRQELFERYAQDMSNFGTPPYIPLSLPEAVFKEVIPGTFGLFAAELASSPYIAAMNQNLGQQLDVSAATRLLITLALSSPYIYTVGVFGAQIAVALLTLSFLTGSKPLALHLHRELTIALMALVCVLSATSNITAIEIVKQFTGEGTPLSAWRDPLIASVGGATSVINLYGCTQLVMKFVERYALSHGSKDTQNRARFVLMNRKLLEFINDKMSPKALADSLNSLSDADLDVWAPIDNLDINKRELIQNIARDRLAPAYMPGGTGSTIADTNKPILLAIYQRFFGQPEDDTHERIRKLLPDAAIESYGTYVAPPASQVVPSFFTSVTSLPKNTYNNVCGFFSRCFSQPESALDRRSVFNVVNDGDRPSTPPL